MEYPISRRLTDVHRSATIALSDQARTLQEAGRSVINLAGGDPFFSTPEHVAKAATEAISEGFTHYTSSRGIPELRAAVAAKIHERQGVDRDPGDEIIITPSAKHALFISLMAILDVGDEVLIPTPSWVSYGDMARLAGARPIPVKLSARDDFRISRELLEAAVSPRSRVLVINTPNNPTGRVLSFDELREIVDFAEAHNLIIVSDEIYEDIVFDEFQHVSITELAGCESRTLVIGGFSKTYAMTGWRLGYVSGPREIIEQALKVQEHTVGVAGSFIQRGGLAALKGDQAPVRAMIAIYAKHRAIVDEGFRDLPGIEFRKPNGAFYAFPGIPAPRFSSSTQFVQWLLEECGVVVTPGSAFGPGGDGHFRISMAARTEIIEEGIRRICDAVARLS
ncbi:pyridoxal phosphate-dependent aminotransferase [Streptomyces kanamyceticus]|uniref:pyridoxal phosphate-dependent aminotransferase n=1 Tax=Streptomyces kanamyceticus TaxID=1967 RepID=UPI0037DD21AB